MRKRQAMLLLFCVILLLHPSMPGWKRGESTKMWRTFGRLYIGLP